MTRRRLLLGTGLAFVLAADAVVLGVLLRRPGLPDARLVLVVSSVCWVAAVALLVALRPGRRATAWVVLGAGLVLGAVALSTPPSTSDDSYRYVWDAKVQLHGIDPYRYTPASPQLARLRDPSLFGPPDHCTYQFAGGCTSINRPTVHTIYPPVAEGVFTVIRAVSFGDHGLLLPYQITALLGVLAVGWLLWRWGAARGRPWLAAVWTWSPVPLVQYANNAHIDWLAALFMVLAFATPVVRRTGWSGALVGAAIATKLYPVLVLPSLMRRRPVVAVASALAVLVLVYLPHVAAVGTGVLGYLPGYLGSENYGTGKRELILGLLVPHPWGTVLGAVVVLAAAVWAWRRGDPAAPWTSAVVVMGVALLAFTPVYGWYSGLLVALVAMTGAWQWAPLTLAGSFAYLARGNDAKWYFIGSLVLLVGWEVAQRIVRRRETRTADPSVQSPPTRLETSE